CDSAGAIHEKRKERMNAYKEGIAKVTNRNMEKGSLKTIIKNKDVFIGVSASNLVSKSMVSSMNKDPIVLALANPIPEIMPQAALDAGAAFAKDGRTVNNCLVFPGLVRGALDALVSEITYPMKFAAAEAIAGLARKHEGVPNFMSLSVHKKVAEKVKQAALNLNR
ncbi:MAG: NAD-dependent malic enzyme, partial [Thermodesulfobacteriota bacterium]|nr:NAD-dependent malic enzyme [Thermodesulfobacteriota bacterium]